MSSTERVKRPKAVRQEPIRSWSTLFEAPGRERAESGERARPGAPGAAPGDAIARSVELGYRVVDEYVRQGQRAARLLSQPSPNPQAIAGDVQRIYLDHLSQLARFWMDAMQIAAPLGPAAPATNEAATSTNAVPAAPRTATTSEPARVRLDIEAHQPTSVSLDLRPESGSQPLIVHALRAADPRMPRLTEVAFHPGSGDEPARLRISVPKGQPPGVYSGLLVDAATNRPVGTISVDVAAA